MDAHDRFQTRDEVTRRRKTKRPKRCPNVLFEKWLQEMYQSLPEDSKMRYVYGRALKSLQKHPLKLFSGKECMILQNFGKKLCDILDKKLEEHIKTGGRLEDLHLVDESSEDEADASTRKPRKRGHHKHSSEHSQKARSQKVYVPAPRTGAYALLVTLHQVTLEPEHKGFMTMAELIDRAQPLCDASFTRPSDPKSHYTAWSSMGALICRKLVDKAGKPYRYSLTNEGINLAEKLVNVSLFGAAASSSEVIQESSQSKKTTVKKKTDGDTAPARPRNQSQALINKDDEDSDLEVLSESITVKKVTIDDPGDEIRFEPDLKRFKANSDSGDPLWECRSTSDSVNRGRCLTNEYATGKSCSLVRNELSAISGGDERHCGLYTKMGTANGMSCSTNKYVTEKSGSLVSDELSAIFGVDEGHGAPHIDRVETKTDFEINATFESGAFSGEFGGKAVFKPKLRTHSFWSGSELLSQSKNSGKIVSTTDIQLTNASPVLESLPQLECSRKVTFKPKKWTGLSSQTVLATDSSSSEASFSASKSSSEVGKVFIESSNIEVQSLFESSSALKSSLEIASSDKETLSDEDVKMETREKIEETHASSLTYQVDDKKIQCTPLHYPCVEDSKPLLVQKLKNEIIEMLGYREDLAKDDKESSFQVTSKGSSHFSEKSSCTSEELLEKQLFSSKYKEVESCLGSTEKEEIKTNTHTRSLKDDLLTEEDSKIEKLPDLPTHVCDTVSNLKDNKTKVKSSPKYKKRSSRKYKSSNLDDLLLSNSDSDELPDFSEFLNKKSPENQCEITSDDSEITVLSVSPKRVSFMYVYLTPEGKETCIKDQAEVLFDESDGFLGYSCLCMKPDLFASGKKYRNLTERGSDVVRVFIHELYCETISSCASGHFLQRHPSRTTPDFGHRANIPNATTISPTNSDPTNARVVVGKVKVVNLSPNKVKTGDSSPSGSNVLGPSTSKGLKHRTSRRKLDVWTSSAENSDFNAVSLINSQSPEKRQDRSQPLVLKTISSVPGATSSDFSQASVVSPVENSSQDVSSQPGSVISLVSASSLLKGRVDSQEVTSSDVPVKSVLLQPGEFKVYLLVDTGETSGSFGRSNQKLLTLDELRKQDIPFEVRRLNVGDYLWVARSSTQPSDELVLPYVIERKRLDDLASSIKDGRYREQKFRLQRSGIQNLIYLVEEYGSRQYLGLPEKSVIQAIVNTQVIDDFLVHWANNTTESIAYVKRMTGLLSRKYSAKTLASSSATQDNPGLSVETLMTFEEFSRHGNKRKALNVSETFGKQLMQLHGVSDKKAASIVARFPTPHSLFEAYKKCRSEQEKEELLSGGKTKTGISLQISRTISMLYNRESM